MNWFWGLALVQLASALCKLIGVSAVACIWEHQSEQFPLNTESGSTQRACMQKHTLRHARTHMLTCTHAQARTHTEAHVQTGAYGGHEGRGSFLFSHSISIYVNCNLVIVQKQPVVWWSDELSWLQGRGQTELENSTVCLKLFLSPVLLLMLHNPYRHTNTKYTHAQLISHRCLC